MAYGGAMGFNPNPIEGIKVNNLGVCYRTVEALRDISLQLIPGKVTGIFGPNGAGKSTLVKAMLGLIPVNAGTVSYKWSISTKPLRFSSIRPPAIANRLDLSRNRLGCSDDGKSQEDGVVSSFLRKQSS
jgi:ABC-type phosphonate transport system ATPase subunit